MDRRTTSIEGCYQNVGIATSVALSMFQNDNRTAAMGVPLLYGAVEAVLLALFCIISWKSGWTKAPASDPFFHVIGTSYEVVNAERMDESLIYEKQDDEHGNDENESVKDCMKIMFPTLDERIEGDSDGPKENTIHSFQPFKSIRSKLQKLRRRGKKEPSGFDLGARPGSVCIM